MSPLLKRFDHAGATPDFSDEELQLFVDLTAELRDTFAKKSLKQIRRSFFVFPSYSNQKIVERMRPFLNSKGFTVVEELLPLDIGELTDYTNVIPLEGHPTARFNKILAKRLGPYFLRN